MRRILIVHNYYQQRGGEDIVVERESALLRAAGYEVATCLRSNDDIVGVAAKVRAAVQAARSPSGIAMVQEAIRRFAPDIVHVHNTFPLFSPAIHAAARALGPATVQTMHNCRSVCANGILMRAGNTCELCVEGSWLNAVRYRCYRGSLLGSLAVGRMIAIHRHRGTWTHDVDTIIAHSGSARALFVRAGMPAEKIVVKPNTVEDPGPPHEGPRDGILFVGRVSPEKGVDILAKAATLSGIKVTVVGDGPALEDVRRVASPHVSVLGRRSPAEVRAHMAKAVAVAIPSLWYESFPLVVAEAFASGTPVIASRIGSLNELVQCGTTGVLAEPGDAASLANAMRHLIGNEDAARRMGRAARALYDQNWSPDAVVRTLGDAYEAALRRRRDDRAVPVPQKRQATSFPEATHGFG